jgi:hypothetical protein
VLYDKAESGGQGNYAKDRKITPWREARVKEQVLAPDLPVREDQRDQEDRGPGPRGPVGPSLSVLYINTLKSVGRLHSQLNTLFYHNSHYYLLVVLPIPSNYIGLVLSSPYPALLTRGPKSTLGTRDTTSPRILG